MPKWINAKERLPENEECVLAVASGRFGNITFMDAVVIAEYALSFGWIVDGYEKWEDPIITYWMPLPKVPGEVE